MEIHNKTVTGLKIAYIGGGSRGWAWGLMSDLAEAYDLSGSVYLYDIDKHAASNNEIIGNKSGGNFKYKACETIGEALEGAEFTIISILPGTFDEMESDVHAPEEYGIYQSVGDTTGPGGIVRALRTIPMYAEIAESIKKYAPKTWVINYTNPMALCVAALYKVFPEIKAFGCCHEVFGTKKLLASVLDEMCGIKNVSREEINANVVGVNHFTWITKAAYQNIDLFELYGKYVEQNYENGVGEIDTNWLNRYFTSKEKVKFDLFRRFGCIAAAGDRHLAEFCPGNWYLKDPETAESWGFNLTPVSWRKDNLKALLEKSARYVSGDESFTRKPTGEEGVMQMRAILGLSTLTTNVNLPNIGQIPNAPLGMVVETNAVFAADSVTPVFAGDIPKNVMSIMAPSINNQQTVTDAALNCDFSLALRAFMTDNLSSRLTPTAAEKLLKTMIINTKKYLPGWKL